MSMLGAAHKSPEAFRTISEVAVELEVPQHVLRFWETKFATIKPLKRGGGRRYYRPDDLDLLRGIRSLLYRDGLTIKGVQKILREQGPRYVMELGRGTASLIASPRAAHVEAEETASVKASNVHRFPAEIDAESRLNNAGRARMTALLGELLEMRTRLGAARRGYSLS
ncbi:MAG TPA: MerR family transcriptional regulator [Micropepsaceae bacterium]|jgi:DNA-binding transcriptional MerR regulator|nr:MerR family transcriptional regulator [Micropepsaceae bacterium]